MSPGDGRIVKNRKTQTGLHDNLKGHYGHDR